MCFISLEGSHFIAKLRSQLARSFFSLQAFYKFSNALQSKSLARGFALKNIYIYIYIYIYICIWYIYAIHQNIVDLLPSEVLLP